MDQSVFSVKNVTKVFGKSEETKVKALDDVSLDVNRGEFLALVGPSGSGKTTLLNSISGLETISAGDIFIEGKNLTSMTESQRSDLRRDNMGFIFQAYNLIPVLNVAENIEYIMMLQGVLKEERRSKVSDILRVVGLDNMERRFPTQLSGGQQQRVAIARAIVSGPSIILADEPTANLDSKTGCSLIDLMQDMNEKYNTTFVFSTHDNLIMERAKRLVVLHDGKIIEDKLR